MYLPTLALGVLAAGLLQGQTLTYQLAPSDGSRFALEVYKTVLMSGKKHVFVFDHFGGEAAFDPRKPAEAKIRFAVEADSVVCTDTWINDGSRKKVQDTARNQMMQADKYPQLSFVSSKAVPLGKEQYDVEGMLTIRDRTRPVRIQGRNGCTFSSSSERPGHVPRPDTMTGSCLNFSV